MFQNDLSYSIKNSDFLHRKMATFQSADWKVATLLNNKAKIVSNWYKNNFLLANKDKF